MAQQIETGSVTSVDIPFFPYETDSSPELNKLLRESVEQLRVRYLVSNRKDPQSTRIFVHPDYPSRYREYKNEGWNMRLQSDRVLGPATVYLDMGSFNGRPYAHFRRLLEDPVPKSGLEAISEISKFFDQKFPIESQIKQLR